MTQVRSNLPRVPITALLNLPLSVLDRTLLLGPPGVGKTETVRRLAEAHARRLGKVFVDLRDVKDVKSILETPQRYFVFLRIIAPHLLPEDIALPKVNGEGVEYVEHKPLLYFAILSRPGVSGILFIDELNNVQRDDQLTMYFSLILEKELAFNVKLSESIIVIAAGNESEWSDVARALPLPLLNRLKILYVTPPSPEDWVGYMERQYGDAWERRVGAFLVNFKEALLARPPDGVENVNFPTPRSWTQLALTLRETPPELWEAVCVGLLGPEWGYKFYAFINVTPRYSVDQVVENPELLKNCELGEAVFLLAALATRSLNEIKQVADYLLKNNRELLVMLLLMMSRDKRLSFLRNYTDVAKELSTRISQYLV